MTVVNMPEGMSMPPGAQANASDRPRLEFGVADGLLHGGGHAAGGVFRAALDFRRNAEPRKRSPQVIDHADLDVRSPQVNSRKKRRLCLLG